MKRILSVCSLLGLLFITGCAGMPGTNTGALVGGVAGAALSRNNPIAGAVIGGVGGALLGNLIDNSGGGNYGYRGNRGYYDNSGYSDRAYYERLQRQRAFEQQRYGGRGCYRCY